MRLNVNDAMCKWLLFAWKSETLIYLNYYSNVNMTGTCRTFQEHADKIERAKAALPSDETLIELANFFDALGDATRIRIVLALTREELCTCDLSKLVGLSVSAVSHQLRVLKDRRIVAYRKEGKNVFYRVDDDHIRAIVEIALTHLKERGGVQ